MNFEDSSGTDYKVKYDTLKAQVDRIQEDARAILELFGARKRSNGSFDIDFAKFAENIGKEKWAELRGVLLEKLEIKSKAPVPLDPETFASSLTVADALKFRAAIDAHHRISGAAGEKPRVRISAASAPVPRSAPKAKQRKRRKKRRDAGIKRTKHQDMGAAATA